MVRARAVEPVERPGGEDEVELGAVGNHGLAEAVEDLDRQPFRVRFGLDHVRRDCSDEDGLGDPPRTVPGNVPGDLSTTGGVADVDDVAQAEVRHHGGGVRCVVVHVVPVADLGGAPVPAAVVGDDAVAPLDEEEQLGVPVNQR